MAILNNVRKFFLLDTKTMLLFVEAFTYLGWARILISVPFSKIAPSLGVHMEETTNAHHDKNKAEWIKVHNAIQIISQHTFWASKCLVRAIAALKMLERRRIESTIYLGTARDESGQMIAHAWLRSGPFYITGAEGMERFAVVGKFAKYISDDFQLDLSHFPKELTLLLSIMKMKEGESLITNNKQGSGEINWDRFLELARHHRVFPVLYRKLKEMDETWIPRDVIQTLRQDYQKNTFQMLQLSAEMEYLCKLFSESSIRSLILKGPVLAADLYGDISLRTSGDLDILIPIHDLDRTEELLGRLGYVEDEYIQTVLNDWKWRHHHVTFFHLQKGIKLEIHWRLGPGPGKEPGFNELWDRKRMSTITSYPVYYLGREDLFLFLVSHGARHGWSRLRWLVDIDQISKQNLNFANLLQLLKKYQLLHIGAQALILASHLLHTPLTSETKSISAEKRSMRLARDALFYIRQMVNLHIDPVPEDVAKYHKRHLFSLMSSQQKVLFIMSFLYPYPEDANTLTLPKRLHFLYFPLRPFLWAWRKTNKQA